MTTPDEVMELPNAIVRGWAVNEFYSTGTEGESLKNIAISFQFDLGGDTVAAQSFILHPDDAAQIRRDLKTPNPLNIQETQS